MGNKEEVYRCEISNCTANQLHQSASQIGFYAQTELEPTYTKEGIHNSLWTKKFLKRIQTAISERWTIKNKVAV